MVYRVPGTVEIQQQCQMSDFCINTNLDIRVGVSSKIRSTAAPSSTQISGGSWSRSLGGGVIDLLGHAKASSGLHRPPAHSPNDLTLFSYSPSSNVREWKVGVIGNEPDDRGARLR